jgi:FkbM family methyltransferase
MIFKTSVARMLSDLGIIYRSTMISRRSLVWAYRLFLDRNPESREVVNEKLRGPIGNIPELRRAMFFSQEFSDRNPDMAPFPMGTIVICELPGGRRLFVDLSDAAIGTAIVRGNYEPELVAALPGFIRPGTLALDIGANVGLFTILLADLVGERGRVIAFEPIAELATLVERSIAENGFGDRVTLARAAVGNRSGSVKIHSTENARNKGAAYLVTGVGGEGPANDNRDVPLVALDSYPMPSPVGFIKIDIEGAEPLFVQGAAELLKRDHPVILSEVHPIQLDRVAGTTAAAYVDSIRGLGYEAFSYDEGRWVPFSTAPCAEDLVTALFVPSGGDLAARLHAKGT